MSEPTGDGTDQLNIGLVAVGMLSALAGAVDACGLSALRDLFVSFMSGNTTSLGMAIGRADWARIGLILSLIACFVTGSASGTVLAIAFGRYHLPGVVAVTAAVLGVAALAPTAGYLAMTFAMGILNAAMDHAGPVSVSVTYVTGTLVKLGRGIGLWICGRQNSFAWLEQGVPWLGILLGATFAAFGLAYLGHAMVAVLPAVASLLAAAFWLVVPSAPSGPA